MSTVTLQPETPHKTVDLVSVLASNIRAEAGRRSLTQTDLANVLGITQSAISRRWNGRRPWPLEDLPTVADALGVTVADLVTPTGRETRLRQDSNLQPRDYVTVSDMWTQAA